MSEYRPTEYVVDFGDCRSNRFVMLNMTLIKQNGAKLHERIVRCRDCKFCDYDVFAYWCCREKYREFKIDSLDGERMGFCAWAERKERIES